MNKKTFRKEFFDELNIYFSDWRIVEKKFDELSDQLINSAVQEEREACAKIAENYYHKCLSKNGYKKYVSKHIAKAIKKCR